jgi:hypothetical protein
MTTKKISLSNSDVQETGGGAADIRGTESAREASCQDHPTFVRGEYAIVSVPDCEKFLVRLVSPAAMGRGTWYVEGDLEDRSLCDEEFLRKVDFADVKVAFRDRYNGQNRVGYIVRSWPTGYQAEISTPWLGDKEPLTVRGRWLHPGDFAIVGPWPEVT